MRRLAILPLLILVGCAQLQRAQGDCFAKYDRFQEAASCIRVQVPSLANTSSIIGLEYNTRMSVLERKVANREMSDSDAKIDLQDFLRRTLIAYRVD